MASYYILTPPAATDPERQTLFIRDGFSWLAFLLPVPWLLVRKLWLIAALALFFYILTIAAAEFWGLDGLPVAYSLVLSLWTGLEGGHVRASWLQRRGWTIRATIVAETIDEAEAAYFASLEEPAAPMRPRFSAPVPAQASNTVTLGLIGPYGSR